MYPDRKVTAAASSGAREEAALIWGRHEIIPGDKVAIIEDLNNNFSTTAQLAQLITSAGGEVVAIMSFYNRSVDVTGDSYNWNGTEIPIITLKKKPIFQYKQDDPFVAEDVAKGNVIWKPKPDWQKLKDAMMAAKNN